MNVVNHKISWILYFGLNDYWLKKSLVKNKKAVSGSDQQQLSTQQFETFNPFSLYNLEGAFIFLGVGLLLSFVVLFMEIFHQRLN